MQRLSAASIALACACLCTAHALAQSSTGTRAHLSWARGVDAGACASEDAIATEVAARLGRDPFDDAAPTRIEGIVTRDGVRWIARIVLRGGDGAVIGERVLASSATSCASLDDASALALALFIDPEAALGPAPTPAPELVAEPPSEPEPPGCPTCPVCATCEASASRGLRGRIEVSAVGALGLLPDPALGIGVGGAITLDRWLELELSLRHLPEVRGGALGQVAGVALTAGRIGARVPLVDDPVLGIGVGAGFLAGAQLVVVHDLVPIRPGEQPWLAVDVGADVRAVLGAGIGLSLWAGITIPLLRSRWIVEGGPSFVEEPVSGALLVSLFAVLR